MRYFYIDFENRKVDGLNGISSLDENDIIKIYYSKDASTITFGLHRRLMESKAEIMYEKIDDAIKISVKNALDVLLLNDLNNFMKSADRNNEYFIVSEDKDYDKFVQEKQQQGFKIEKIAEIKNCHEIEKTAKVKTKQNKTEIAPKMSKEEQAFRSYLGRYMKEFKPYKEEIVKAYFAATKKNDFHNNLMSSLKDHDVVKQIYNCEYMKKYKNLLE